MYVLCYEIKYCLFVCLCDLHVSRGNMNVGPTSVFAVRCREFNVDRRQFHFNGAV